MKNFKFQKGFTLIELLVAMSLFIVFIAIASGGFIRALRTQRAIVALMSVNDNASLVLEQMSREMRTGYNFCTRDYPVISVSDGQFLDCAKLAPNELMFVNARNEIVFYRLNDKSIERGIFNYSSGRADYNNGKITGENISVERFGIKLMGNGRGDGFPPRISISIRVKPETEIDYLNNFYSDVQSTVSSRSLDT